MLVPSGGEQDGVPRIGNVLLLLRTGDRERNENHEYAFLQYEDVISSRNKVDEMLGWV